MSFDRVANYYAWMEKIVFGNDLEKIRNVHLKLIDDAESILLLGDGDGRFLKKISETGADGLIVSLDSSSKMIELSRKRLQNTDLEVQYFCQNIKNFEKSESFKPDLIFAHFFLDCFTEDEVILIIDLLSQWSTKTTKIVVSDFFITKTNSISGTYQKLLTQTMISFFRVFCGISANKLPNIPKIMNSKGWNCISHKSLRNGFINSWVWQIKGYGKRP